MDVVGGAVAGFLDVFLFLFACPLIAVMVLRNLNYFQKISKATALVYIVSYLGFFILEVFLFELALSLSAFNYFSLFLFALCCYTYALRNTFKNVKRVRQICGAITFVILVICCFYSRPAPKIQNRTFEQQMAKALNLTFCSTSILYTTPLINVTADTVVGLFDGRYSPQREWIGDRYFIGDIKNGKQKVYKKASTTTNHTTKICYNNGQLYAGMTGDLIRNVSDTSKSPISAKIKMNSYFINSLGLYKNRVIAGENKKVEIFNKKSGTLLKKMIGVCFSNLIGNKLFVIENQEKLICLNLDDLQNIWECVLPGKAVTLSNHNKDTLVHNEKYIALSVSGVLTLIDIATGQIKASHAFADDQSLEVMMAIDRSYTYISKINFTNTEHQLRLDCVNNESGNLIWRNNSLQLVGIYKTYVIAIDKDNYYHILENTTGKEKAKILRSAENDLSLMGNYVLIRSEDLGTFYQ